MAHAPYAPSSAHRWLACPGSVKMCEGLPDKSTPAAEEGTFAHAIAEKMLRSWDKNLREYCHNFIGETDGRHVVTPEMDEHLRGYVDYVAYVAGARRVLVEQTVQVIPGVCWGTADAVVLPGGGEDFIDIIDLKYGSGQWVDAQENAQLLTYAVGAFIAWDNRHRAKHGTGWSGGVRMHVYQPRHHQAVEGSKWGGESYYSANRNKLLAHLGRITSAVDQTELKAGKHCKWCPAEATCPALRDFAAETARTRFHALPGSGPPLPPEPKTLSPEELATVLDAIPVVQSWIKAVQDHAHGLARAGVEIPRHKLIDQKANRKWCDEELAEQALTKLLPKGRSPRAPGALLSPAQAEKLLKKSDHWCVKLLASRETKGTRLVPETHRAPAVRRAAFTPLPGSGADLPENQKENQKND